MQKKIFSLIEAVSNTAIGLCINVLLQHMVFPLFGIYISWTQNFQIAMIFTVISILRGYILRRLFTKQKKQHEY